jgi:hypothetical protein
VHVQGGDQGLGAVAHVLELAPPRTPWSRHAICVLALQGLDSRLLID